MEINLNAPFVNLSASLQLSIDCVGHALRAVDAYVPDRDHTLPLGVIMAFGVSTESHVPGAPIAFQIAPSIPLQLRPQGARSWILRKGMSDVVTSLSLFALQQHAACCVVDVLKSAAPSHEALDAAASTESAGAQQFDRRSLPEKARQLRQLAALENDAELLDLEDRVLSINRTRNCLEHRGGSVGPQDCPATTPDEMWLRWIGPDLTADGKDETINPDEYVGTLRVQMRAKRERTFRKGDVVILSDREYAELCWTIGEYAKIIDLGIAARVRADPALKHLLDRPSSPGR